MQSTLLEKEGFCIKQPSENSRPSSQVLEFCSSTQAMRLSLKCLGLLSGAFNGGKLHLAVTSSSILKMLHTFFKKKIGTRVLMTVVWCLRKFFGIFFQNTNPILLQE